MACYHPIKVHRSPDGYIDWNLRSDKLSNFLIPCGRCVGCRLEYSRQWMIRIMHEASLYDENCFLTLTYSDDYLKPSLDYSDFQKFFKRYRKRFSDRNIRFYMCGEYGDLNKRPHFHACVFNHDFPDKKLFSRKRGNRLYTSEILADLWPFGYSTIGSLTSQSAAYVSRYIMKKQGQDNPSYERVDESTGEVTRLVPEFCRMSLKPGIGQGWFDKYHSDVFPADHVVFDGKQLRPPKFYLRKYKDLCKNNDQADLYDSIVEKRRSFMQSPEAIQNNTSRRLKVREVVALAKLRSKKREV